jgi:5'-nucleotidase
MKILLTNDDGIYARGIHALVKELNSLAEIYVVSPDRERSGTGHSITVYEPIKVKPVELAGAKSSWTVGGTPVDCVKLALARLINEKIDLVVSGINHGSNMGTDVLYSGTVSAAAEGVILGCPSIAVSMDSPDPNADFTFTARFTKRLVQKIMTMELSRETLLNVNLPAIAPDNIKGVRITRLGVRNYDNLFDERQDPRGNTYFWLGGGVLVEEQEPDSDVAAVQDGYISITPIRLDLTDYKLIEEYRQTLQPYLEISGEDHDNCQFNC